jgi:CRP-like cAMP-binding protein
MSSSSKLHLTPASGKLEQRAVLSQKDRDAFHEMPFSIKSLSHGRRDARTRVAHLLCEIAVRLQSAGLMTGNRYELPMTQEQIGNATGLTTVHVNRTFQGSP